MQRIADPDAIVAELEQAWASSAPPCSMFGEETRPIRDHPAGRPVGTTVNPYWQIVRLFPIETNPFAPCQPAVPPDAIMPPVSQFACSPIGALRNGNQELLHRFMFMLWLNWDTLRLNYSWPIISPSDLTFLQAAIGDRGLIDIGAGSGYLAWQLAQLGVDVLAYDIAPHDNDYILASQYHPVHRGGPEKAAAHSDRILLLSWPPKDNPMAVQTLAAYRGDTVIYIGELRPGCIAEPAFFDRLYRDWALAAESPEHLSFKGIKCHVTIWHRRPRSHEFAGQ